LSPSCPPRSKGLIVALPQPFEPGIPPQRCIQRIDPQQPPRDRGRSREQVFELVEGGVVLSGPHIDLRQREEQVGPHERISSYREKRGRFSPEPNRVRLATQAGIGLSQTYSHGPLLCRRVPPPGGQFRLENDPGGVEMDAR